MRIHLKHLRLVLMQDHAVQRQPANPAEHRPKKISGRALPSKPGKKQRAELKQRQAAQVVALRRKVIHLLKFKNKKELLSWADRIGIAYNNAFVNNWEYYPLTQREIDFVVQNIMAIADYRLIKIITHGEDVVGFLFAFHDVSAALQRAKGGLFPLGLFDILSEMRRANTVAVNGMGILPHYQGHGGNALLYYAMGKTLL